MPRVVNKGVSINYRVEGSGPPIVFGHGLTSSSDVWYERGFVAALKPKYRLVLIDTRGHGQSDKPHDPQSYTTEKCASDIVAVLDDLGMKTATYWGYSQGGQYGYALAQHALDRVACFVIGGATAGSSNVISGNTGQGILLSSTASNEVVTGNRIGTNTTGTAALPNGSDGVTLSAGAASINPSDGPSRAERSYTPVKIGATQQEHNINGAPASPANTCERIERLPNKRDNHSGETNVLTAALMRMPKTSAGQITRK